VDQIYSETLEDATLDFRAMPRSEIESLRPELQQAYYDRIHLKRKSFSNIPVPLRWWESDYTIQNEFIKPYDYRGPQTI
jgi:hypothetical protein